MERDIKSLKADLSSYIKTDLDYFEPILQYIKLYYLMPDKFTKFLSKHPDFDIGLLTGIVNIAPEVQKLKKSEIKSLVSSIEEFYVNYLSRM